MSDSLRALVVDDEPVARKSVQFALEQEGFQCDLAADGVAALHQLRDHDYALVVTDLRMPKMHGHALSVEVLAKMPRPVVVIHSSVDHPQLTKDLILRGVDDIVYKPTNYSAFAAKMKALVSRRRIAAPTDRADTREDVAGADDAALAAADDTSHATGKPVGEPGGSAAQFVPVDTPVPQSDLEEDLPRAADSLGMPPHALSIFEMTRAGCDTHSLGAAIQHEPTLASELLSIASSDRYNSTGKALTEIDQAVVRLGQRRTGEFTLATSILNRIAETPLTWWDSRARRRHGLAAGVAAELLISQGKHSGIGEHLPLLAMTHGLGRVALGMLYPGHYQHLANRAADHHEAAIEQERQLFPEDPGHVMARLLAQWELPEELIEPAKHLFDNYASVAHLPDPLRTRVELVKLAVLLGRIAARAWQPWDLVEIPPASLMLRLQITDLADVLQQTRANALSILGAGPDDSWAEAPAVSGASDRRPKLPYAFASPARFDFLAQVIRDAGFELKPLNKAAPEPPEKVFVNAWGASNERAAADLPPLGGSEVWWISDGASDGMFGETAVRESIELPVSYSRLCTAMQAAAGAPAGAVAQH